MGQDADWEVSFDTSSWRMLDANSGTGNSLVLALMQNVRDENVDLNYLLVFFTFLRDLLVCPVVVIIFRLSYEYEKRCNPYFLEMALSEQRLPQNVRRPVRAEVPRRPQSLLQGEEKANWQQMITIAVASRLKFGGWSAD